MNSGILIRTACLAALGVAAAPVSIAQQATDTGGAETKSELEEVVVTGFRASLEAGAEIKRDSVQFVDAIVADDIGKLPDSNVAESLQRVSGVQLSRGIGEGSDISIRGLRQNVILLNGRTIVNSSGRGGNGPDTLETSTYGTLAQIPSELISRLEVTKQPGADEIEGGLGGIVNIITRRPLDHAGFQIVGSAGATYSELADSTGYEAFSLISDTFANDTFGLQLSARYSENDLREDGFNSFTGYVPLLPAFNTNPDGINFDPNGDGQPGSRIADFRYQQIDDTRKRLGVEAVMQWRPTDSLELAYDGFYSKLDSDRERHWFSILLADSGTQYSNVVLSEHETLIAGTINTPLQTNYELAESGSETFSNAFTARWQGESTTVFGEISYTRAEEIADQGYARLESRQRAPVGFDLRGSVPSLSLPGNVSVVDPASMAATVLFDNIFEVETTDLAARIDIDHSIDVGPLTSFEYGARYQELKTDRDTDMFQQSGLNIPLADVAGNITTFSSPDFLDGKAFGVPATYLSWTGRRQCEEFFQYFSAASQAACLQARDPNRSYNVDEDITAAYVKSAFSFNAAAREFQGNLGVRYVSRDVTSAGAVVIGALTIPDVQDVKQEEWLPSAVIKTDLTDDIVARFGVARVVSFPNTEDLSNTLSVSGVNADGSVSADVRATGGNPALDPFLVNQADLSFEWYFAEGSVASMGLFYKDVESFIVTRVRSELVPGVAVPIPTSRRINGEGGEISGIELLYQQKFDFLPAPFDGLGLQSTYSYIDSQTPFRDGRTGETLPIPGLSQNNVNLVAIYEKGPFGLRLAYNWRDEYFDSIGVNGGGVYFDSYDDLALTVRYDISDAINLSFEAANLLDTELVRYNSVPEALNSTQQYGRIYSLTVRARW
ncbi:TonB-dependent receptor [Peristeroidobacter soli]|uniref:TonB-dependent receptor n=1 Tax=Peristeroidobacter soli TaxID=2497877 RepID=UPI00101DCFC2|nr:TonB-dependent receptor [Peristeroidobacter soli]